jgi:hypothetical protein
MTDEKYFGRKIYVRRFKKNRDGILIEKRAVNRFHQCRLCGSIVGDRKVHDEWHEKYK